MAKIKYSEPSNYISKDILKKHGLGNTTKPKTTKKPKRK